MFVLKLINKTRLSKGKYHKHDIEFFFIFPGIFCYGVQLGPSWYDPYVKYVGRMRVKHVTRATALRTFQSQSH